ncbi:MAG: adenine deaminase, partial [Anaerolineales bacterium]
DATNLAALRVMDCNGMFALPGFIDTHIHIDSTLLSPEQLATLIVPHGTTTLLADPMEIANVGGYAGMQALIQAAKSLPFNLWIEVSARVPTAPGLETSGGKLDLYDVRHILKWQQSVSLGELDPAKVLGFQEEYLAKIQSAHFHNKIANGHAAGLLPQDLTAYACAGLADDHECVDIDDALARLRLGMAVLIREGSTERNLRNIIQGVVKENLDTKMLMFCTDDKHPDDILREGHIDWMVNQAILFGIPPITAIQMATWNAARHFRLDHEIGGLGTGRRADIILSESLKPIIPQKVFVGGKLVAEDGHLINAPKPAHYPSWLKQTIKVTRGKQADDFRIPVSGKRVNVRVITIYPDQIINHAETAQLTIENDAISCNTNLDIIKLAVVERYGKNGNIGIAFVKGFGLQQGAIASSVSHDHHNIVIAGVDDADMALCVAEIEKMQGGLVVTAKGNVLARLALPIAGLMTQIPAQEVIQTLKELNNAARSIGCQLPAPFMTLSFISLPTVPELGLTDRGLVDVRQHTLINPIIAVI